MQYPGMQSQSPAHAFALQQYNVEGEHNTAAADIEALSKQVKKLQEDVEKGGELREQLSRTNTKLAEEGQVTAHLANAIGERD